MTLPGRVWIRLYRETHSDPKLRRFTPAQRWLWIVLLCLADDDGVVQVAPGVGYSMPELERESDLPAEQIEVALTGFAALSMIAAAGSTWRIVHWSERQFHSDTSTPRVIAFRQRQRETFHRNVTETKSETLRAEQSRAERDKDTAASHDAAPARKRKASAPTDPNVRVLVEHYAAEVERLRGVKPVIRGAVAGSHFKALLAGRTVEEARAIVTDFLEHPPQFYADRQLFEPEHVVKAANTVLARRCQ